MHLKLRWIANDLDRPLLSVAEDIIDNTCRSLTPLFFQNPAESPLEKAAVKINRMSNRSESTKNDG